MDRILIATPVEHEARHFDTSFAALSRLTYPADRLSLDFLESDSLDAPHAMLEAGLPDLRSRHRGTSPLRVRPQPGSPFPTMTFDRILVAT